PWQCIGLATDSGTYLRANPFVESERAFCQARLRVAPRTSCHTTKQRRINDLAELLTVLCKVVETPAFLAHLRVFHSDFRSVFRRNCVKVGSPSRTIRGEIPVKSTMAEGFPSRGPSSSTKSI